MLVPPGTPPIDVPGLEDRPGLAALLDYVRAGDTVVVVVLDRLGRSLSPPRTKASIVSSAAGPCFCPTRCR